MPGVTFGHDCLRQPLRLRENTVRILLQLEPPAQDLKKGKLKGLAMRRRISLTVVVLAVTGVAGNGAAQQAATQPAEERVPSLEEIHALADRAIANQHNDDAALESYELIERRIVRSSAKSQTAIEDKTYRVVPTGTATLKLLLKDRDRPVDAETYRQELQAWEQALSAALRPDDPGVKALLAKQQKKRKDRADLVDAAHQAFHATWLGRETRYGRVLDKLALEPNPQFQSKSTSAEMLTHARATIWIDEQTGHLARIEADIIRDISFGAGILGKVYRGGHFSLERAEVAPGVWFPMRYQLDFVGRKFLFTFEVHEVIEDSRYRRLGSPSQALEIARHDLANFRSLGGDP